MGKLLQSLISIPGPHILVLMVAPPGRTGGRTTQWQFEPNNFKRSGRPGKLGEGTTQTAGWRGRGLGISDSEGGMVGLQAEKPESGSGMGVRGALMSLQRVPQSSRA